MNQPAFKLPNAPIVEAVLDIECDLPPGTDIVALQDRGHDMFSAQYPVMRAQYVHEHQIAAKPGEPPEVSVSQGVQALQFLQADEKQLVQVRAQGYAFNRLAPYTSLDDYLPEIERTWRLYVELAKPVLVRSVRLRYINRIVLPLTDRRVGLDNYFRIAPRLPEEEKLSLHGFLNQYAASETDTGNQVSIVITALALEDDKVPVIFDNSVTAAVSAEPENWTWILDKILELRDLKNRVFRGALTDKCLDLFQ
jgi:uncharacterized protein (TIGR04255 family)